MEFKKIILFFTELMTRPVSPLPLGVYRSLLGILALINGILLQPDLLVWFGESGVLPSPLAATSAGRDRLSLLIWLGSSNQVVYAVFGVFMASALLTALGLFTRAATIALFIATVSLHHRNMYILNSGDSLFRIMSFFLMLAPSGTAFSLDRLMQVRKGKAQAGIYEKIPATAFRLMQFQLLLLYFATGFWKAGGGKWMDGTAVFMVNQLQQFERFPVPAFMRSLWFSKIMTWNTLALELSAPFLLCFRETRLLMLGALVLLHAGLEYTMNIQLFQPIIMSVFVLFLTESEIRRAFSWFKRLFFLGRSPSQKAESPGAASHPAIVMS